VGISIAVRCANHQEYVSIVAGAAATIRGWGGVQPARLGARAIARRTS
jgi:hypothetical protein